jgi:hypothetical protein
MRLGNCRGRISFGAADNRRRIPCYSLLLKFPLAAHVAELLDPIERSLIFSLVKKARPASF